MHSCLLRGFILSSSMLLAAAAGAAPSSVTCTRVQHRSVFDLVGGHTDLRAVCGSNATATAITYRRTPADLAAGIFTGWWYTPVHVRVTCTPTP